MDAKRSEVQQQQYAAGPVYPPQNTGQQTWQQSQPPPYYAGQPVMPQQGQPMVGQQGQIMNQEGVVYHQPVVVVNQVAANAPPDNMMLSVIATIFCCWPIGLFAIMKSMACRDAVNRGDRQAAEEYSKQARRLAHWTIGVGVVTMVLSITIVVVMYAVVIIPSYRFG